MCDGLAPSLNTSLVFASPLCVLLNPQALHIRQTLYACTGHVRTLAINKALSTLEGSIAV